MAKLSPEDIRARIVSLETVYTQKQLAEKLGISKRSLNYYAKGERLPNKKATEKINRTFNKEKPRIIPEKVQARETKRQAQSTKQKILRETFREAPIIDYMFAHKNDLDNFPGSYERLENLTDLGYGVAWVGRNLTPPLECQFIIHGEDPRRAGMNIFCILVIQKNGSPTFHGGYNRMDVQTIDVMINRYMLPGFRGKNFQDRMNAVRTTVFQSELGRGIPVAMLGYYFSEGDE